MTKLILATMCVGTWVGTLAGCTSSTMPAPNDPATAIHEEPVMTSGGNGASNPMAPTRKANLADSATAAK